MPTVAIDCFHEHLPAVPDGCAIVTIDVIRATTTAITAAALGRRLHPAGSIEAAVRIAADLHRPVLAGELGGVMPYGFDMQNSPSQIAALEPSERPIILLSTSGTRLIAEASARVAPPYLACLRNARAQARRLCQTGDDVLVLGADSRGEFREEDQLCAARIGAALTQDGYDVANRATAQVIERWADAPEDDIAHGRSATYLRDTGQERDLAFVLEHVDDLDATFVTERGEVHFALPA